MKQTADAKRKDVSFEVGDWVFLKLQAYKKRSIFRRLSQKLSIRYFGSFRIIDKLGTVAYRLKLPDGSLFHFVFNVSLLKKRIGEDTPTPDTFPALRSNGLLHRKPKAIRVLH